uniref:Uncharacterized protein LOC111133819 n=1 Tax=Crassostrea virginica TaxID=6565 RepID=A0A8B8EC42_CRAVI|nr:uncharacterized protein LOC111133819 [Crassostrea virginica]
MIALLLVLLAVVATNAQTAEQAEPANTLDDQLLEAKTWRKDKWQTVSDAFGLVSYKWTTTLPTNTVVNETAYLAESKNVLLMKSRDRDLKDQGYDKSTTLVDFGSGMVAFRTKFPATSELPAEAANTEGLPRRERRKRLRKFFAGRDEACFFTDTTVTLAQVKAELQNRVANSPVQTGTTRRFVAEEKNRLTTAELTKLNSKIARFCSKAAKHDNNFRLVEDSTATTHPDSLVVMGQFDPASSSTSIPFEIRVEQSVIDAVQKQPATTESTPAAGA